MRNLTPKLKIAGNNQVFQKQFFSSSFLASSEIIKIIFGSILLQNPKHFNSTDCHIVTELLEKS